jgi:hypothetical protein
MNIHLALVKEIDREFKIPKSLKEEHNMSLMEIGG